MARISVRFVPVAMATALLVAACGSEAPAEGAKGVIADDATTTTAAPATTAAPVEETTTTAEATTTTVAETTTTAAPVISGPADGVLYTNTDGLYVLQVSPAWTEASDQFPNGIDGWFTGEESPDFAENVNIVTQTIPTATPLQDILDGSITQLESQFEAFVLIRSEVVPGSNHPELGLIEYTAVQAGLDIQFVQVFGIWNDTLVVVTGSTDGRLGSEGADRIRPYALSVAPAG